MANHWGKLGLRQRANMLRRCQPGLAMIREQVRVCQTFPSFHGAAEFSCPALATLASIPASGRMLAKTPSNETRLPTVYHPQARRFWNSISPITTAKKNIYIAD